MKAEHIPVDYTFTVGEKIGWLTIVSTAPFKVKCDCGKEWTARRSALTINGVRSCGCRQKYRGGKPVVAPGVRCGIFEVLHPHETVKHKWVVRCTKCGMERSLSRQNLINASLKRCQLCP